MDHNLSIGIVWPEIIVSLPEHKYQEVILQESRVMICTHEIIP